MHFQYAVRVVSRIVECRSLIFPGSTGTSNDLFHHMHEFFNLKLSVG